jgi:Protein of unknown function (DUF5818)
MRNLAMVAALTGMLGLSVFVSAPAQPAPIAHSAATTLVPPAPITFPSQNSPKDQPHLSTFTGTIAKNGDEFVLNEAKTHKLYELDDQDTASKFVEKNVRITGTLDVVKNIIRIQSIAEVAA